jgi:hypothetical protein
MGSITKAVHDTGLAVWWGGTLMGTMAMNPAVEVLDDPEERGKMVDEGWARFQPWAAAGLMSAIVTHIIMRRRPPRRPHSQMESAPPKKKGRTSVRPVAPGRRRHDSPRLISLVRSPGWRR